MIPTTLAPFLSVRNGAKAVDFYKSAFGANEIFRHEDPTGAVVSNLAINGYGFWVADEAPEHKNFSPETLNGGSVRMILTIEDPDAAFDRAVAAGAHHRLPHKNRARLAHRPRPRPLRPPLGDRQTTSPLIGRVTHIELTPQNRVPHISILRCGHSRKARTQYLKIIPCRSGSSDTNKRATTTSLPSVATTAILTSTPKPQQISFSTLFFR
jgi:PhnB protein